MACSNGDVLVWYMYSTQGRGWCSEKRRRLPVAALYSRWFNGKEDEDGAQDAIGNNFLNGPHRAFGGIYPPTCIAEVCPPGMHVLERGVKVSCGAKRSRNGWFSEGTFCVEPRTDRCKLCPYWRRSSGTCHGEAWDNSAGLAQEWNSEAGLTTSRTLYRPREGTAYGCIYSNLETP